MEKPDFGGWATRANLRCSDGRVILRDAFKDNDKGIVPLVWNHQNNDPDNVLGHALLENREDGVYAYGFFNDNPKSQRAKNLVKHGDICSLSIFANQLKQDGSAVRHGRIIEVSLVTAGANPGAFIDDIMAHSGDSEAEGAIMFSGEEGLDLSTELSHADMEETNMPENKTMDDETIADVIKTMNDKQRKVLNYMVGEALSQSDDSDDDGEDEAAQSDDTGETFDGEDKTMKHNVFDGATAINDKDTLTHSEMTAILNDAKRYGSVKESALQHGIEQVDWLFPEPKTQQAAPEFITRKMDWVMVVMNGVHHTPFSRVKSLFADLTEDEARARGYMKGKLKKEQVFSLLKRTTTPTTVYKKQKMDRDDVIDITDFDVISWLKQEMRFMLDEELARAFLIGDGRLASSDDKINETNIRPIWTDEELYTINQVFTAGADESATAKAMINAAIRGRKNYRGSGNPTLFTTEDDLTNMLLLTDTTGRDLFADEAALARKLRVSRIVTVPVMEGQTREVGSKTRTLHGIIVNLNDYNVGADRGGAVNMFDDFDIDYNQQKYLIETRCSGALIKPYSAIVLEIEAD